MKRFLVAALTACSGLVVSTSASAAPAMPCAPAIVTPQSASIPANLPAFGYTAVNATLNDIHLRATSGAAAEVPLTFGRTIDGYLEVKPSAPLVPGTAYELQYSPFCSYGAYPSAPLAFVADPEAPLPTKLGDLVSGPTVSLKDYGTTQVTISATYTLADEMKPWVSVYELGMSLDGKVIETHRTAAGGAAIQIDAKGWCDAATSSLTKHTIQLQAHLPFAPPVASLPTTMDFTCPPPSINTPPNNPATPPTGNASSSSGLSGSSGSSGIDGSGQPRRTTVNGCSTTAVASSAMSSGTSSFASIGLLFGLAMLVRRRLSGASAASRRT
ncbi:MAG: hypothetical protein JWO86_4091 [Myxococcaceae bacterium]|nr:hypothetical protein [Myxococcaceae bacterium]